MTGSSSLYTLSALSLQGKEISLSDYEGRVILFVNTASKCGFTPQYAGLQALHERYHHLGLSILGFPCNQFGSQEPGNAAQIAEGCLINYGVEFTMFQKIEVNGRKVHPVFKYLKSQLPGILGPRINWNFTKFLVDKHGKPFRRFSPRTKPERLTPYIDGLLSDPN